MIEVRLFATLRLRAREEEGRIPFPSRPGLSVADVVGELGLDPADIHIVMVNGIHAALDTELEEGDRVGLFPPVGGG